MSRHPPFKEVEASRPDFENTTAFHYTKTPQPDWKVGQGANNADLPSAEGYRTGGKKRTYYPGENLSKGDTYKLLINSVVPRPIGFCSTLGPNGESNLSPFSYFSAAGHEPPILSVGISANGPQNQKDTAANIKATKQWVANIISEPFIEAANYTSIDAPRDVSEWALSGLTQTPSSKVKPACVKEAAISMECVLEHLYDMYEDDTKKLTQTVFLGRIVAWHVREDILIDGGPTIAVDKLMPVSRLGGISYGRTVAGFELARPRWSEEKEKPEVQAALQKGASTAKI